MIPSCQDTAPRKIRYSAVCDQFESTGYVMQVEVVPDAFSTRAVQVIFQ